VRKRPRSRTSRRASFVHVRGRASDERRTPAGAAKGDGGLARRTGGSCRARVPRRLPDGRGTVLLGFMKPSENWPFGGARSFGSPGLIHLSGCCQNRSHHDRARYATSAKSPVVHADGRRATTAVEHHFPSPGADEGSVRVSTRLAKKQSR
jgi:hypothetical protein